MKASVNYVGRTSMEIGVRAEAENTRTGEIRHAASAYATMVALDNSGFPTEVPRLVPETEGELRRFKEGELRRQKRLKNRKKPH